MANAQFFNPFLGAIAPSFVPYGYSSIFENPYYYDTSLPIASFGQFDPSINLNNVSLSLDLLYPITARTYDPASLQGLYNFSPAPFNYIWNSLAAGQGETITVNPYFALPNYYSLLQEDYFATNTPEREVPLSLYSLYSFAPIIPEIYYSAWQADLIPQENFVNSLALNFFPIF